MNAAWQNDQLWRDLRHGRTGLRENRDKGVRWRVFIERFNQRYHICIFAECNRKRSHGYVETILGRRRYQFHERSVSSETASRKNDLDSLRGLTAYDAGLLRAAANARFRVLAPTSSKLRW